MKKFLVPSIFMAAILGACNFGSSSSSEDTEKVHFVETENELPDCTSKKEGEKLWVKENDVIYTCHNGVWEGAVALSDEYDSYDHLPKCSSKKEGQLVKITGDEGTTVCHNKKWVQNISVVDTEDEVPACSKKRENFLVYVTESNSLLVCDGEWVDADDDDE